ncbi:MAG: leucine-rich repeat domain-containing protein [Bacillales bacterium]|jgi:hypothetical protein|nr:leucine-rich repeat domain-containing protein [Bacillales bacterium]
MKKLIFILLGIITLSSCDVITTSSNGNIESIDSSIVLSSSEGVESIDSSIALSSSDNNSSSEETDKYLYVSLNGSVIFSQVYEHGTEISSFYSLLDNIYEELNEYYFDFYLDETFLEKVVFPLIVDRDITIFVKSLESTNGLIYKLLGDNTYSVSATNDSLNNNNDVVIPYYHNGLSVSTIDSFYGCYNLESIILPNSIINIGSFYNCNSLKSIVIPRSVESIRYHVFYGCRSLTSISVENNNYFTSIDGVLFDINVSKLIAYPIAKTTQTYNLPYGVKSIDDETFKECHNLKEIILPDSVESIGENAFRSSGLINITIPDSVTSLGAMAFNRCTSLKSITLSNNITVINDQTFYGCASLESIVIPDSVTVMGIYIFYLCSKLTSVILSNNLTNIGIRTFYQCTSLTSVVLPEGLISIGVSAFAGCSSLTDIDIPDSITSIGDTAFSSCYNLKTIIIPNKVEIIGDGSFSNCLKLESIILSNSLIYIGADAFNNCRILKTIIIPSSVTVIMQQAFKSCTIIIIYAEVLSQPSGWDLTFNYSNRPIYWGGTWHIDGTGNPTPN